MSGAARAEKRAAACAEKCAALREEKRAARRAAALRASALPPEAWREAGLAMAKTLFARDEWRRAGVVFCFASAAREPDTWPILRRALAEGKRLCVPLCEGGGMTARAVSSLKELSPGAWGIAAPGKDAPRVEAGEIGLCLAPCAAMDRRGVRLGRGGGYYDRFLPRLAPGTPVFALCMRELLFDALPAEAHDARIARILTQDGVLPAAP